MNEGVLEAARRQAVSGATFVKGDMRDLGALPGEYDAVINMWQSFGYFDFETNRAGLRGMRDKLRPEGRLILDIKNREFYMDKGAKRVIERGGKVVIERSRMEGHRQVVELDYGSGERDFFSWHLFTISEISLLAKEIGLETVLTCAWFDESQPVTPNTQRMQLVFERLG